MIAEAVLTREQRYLHAIERALTLRDRAVATQERAVKRVIATMRARLIDELMALPTRDGKLRADALSTARISVDQNVAAMQRELTALFLHAGRILAQAGSNLTPMALVSAGVAPERTLMLIPKTREAALPDDFEDVHWLPLDTSVMDRIETMLAQQVIGISDLARHQLRVLLTRALNGDVSLSALLSQVRVVLATQPMRGVTRLGPIAAQAERIVRTELMGAFSTANQARSEEMEREVPELRKYWLATHDARVRTDHRSAGSRYAPDSDPGPIPSSALFTVGGEKCNGPHDARLSARQRVNCRCVRIAYSPDWFAA